MHEVHESYRGRSGDRGVSKAASQRFAGSLKTLKHQAAGMTASTIVPAQVA
jgi:hypothetical protein